MPYTNTLTCLLSFSHFCSIASLAWAIVSLGLQLVQYDQDRISAVFDASAFLTDILHRYANIETHYRDQDLPGVEDLEDRICLSYEAILAFVAMVRKQQDKQFWGREILILYI